MAPQLPSDQHEKLKTEAESWLLNQVYKVAKEMGYQRQSSAQQPRYLYILTH